MHLSGGEKKMVSIARALALDPSPIIRTRPLKGWPLWWSAILSRP
jgi:ABC-type transporter Mla maintaining outer membrane lipid asymmetry ATPase subunit MlaF